MQSGGPFGGGYGMSPNFYPYSSPYPGGMMYPYGGYNSYMNHDAYQEYMFN